MQHAAEELFDVDLFSDGVDACEVSAELEAVLLRGVVGGRPLHHAVSRPIDAAAATAGEPAPLRPAAFPPRCRVTATCYSADVHSSFQHSLHH